MQTLLGSEIVDAAFLALLGRLPENEDVRAAFQKENGVAALVASIKASGEYQHGKMASPLSHFHAQIDAIEAIKRHEKKDREAVAGRIVNFLGVVIDPAFLPHILKGMEGRVEGLPLPSNWHADIAEFAAALRAVDLAKDTFRVLELGCGWGCWLLNTGVAARNRGLAVELIGAEADEGHVAFAERGCAENGFKPDDVRIHRVIIGAKAGTALFPRQDKAGVSWGLQPVFDASPEQVAQANDRYDILPVMPLSAIAGDDRLLDLVHMDIQGGEADFIDACMDDLKRQAAYIVIGTHSRMLEGRIMAAMLREGWILEIERPAIFGFDSAGLPTTLIDGVQGWRNPDLRPI